MKDRDLLRTHHTLEHLQASSMMIGEEFLAGFEEVEKIDRPAVSCFGSARAPEGSRPYAAARRKCPPIMTRRAPCHPPAATPLGHRSNWTEA